ncbi:MAG: AIM24 family protein, partial [Oscillospiraceae bacterium]|nr:AIM24 family protein [Oscillospiraceae bacterium]
FTSTLTGNGQNAFVALLSDGNPLVLSNLQNNSCITVDPDAVICWFSRNGYGDPQIRTDISWKNFIGQHSGESYMFEWSGGIPVSVLIQPSERRGGIKVGID